MESIITTLRSSVRRCAGRVKSGQTGRRGKNADKLGNRCGSTMVVEAVEESVETKVNGTRAEEQMNNR